MRRRTVEREPISRLVALFVTGYERHPERFAPRLMRELGRLPDAEDVDEAHRVLDDARAGR